jgi:acetyl esterase/lipase
MIGQSEALKESTVSPTIDFEEKFSSFNYTEKFYKTLPDGSKIRADVWIPKVLDNIDPKVKRPVAIRFHGGYLFSSDAKDDWLRPWLLDYIVRSGAVLVSFNYRLLPESDGLAILQDLEDAARWIGKDFNEELDGRVQIDPESVLVVGDSGGERVIVLKSILS